MSSYAGEIGRASSVAARINRGGRGWRLAISKENIVSTGLVVWIAGLTLSKTLFNVPIPSRPFWFAGYLAVAIVLLRHHDAFLRLLRDNLLVLCWALLALFSSLWAYTPSATAYNAFQLLMTVLIGFVFADIAGPKRMLRLLFFAFLVVNLASLAFFFVNRMEATGAYGELRGIYFHKNEMGLYAILLLITSCCLFIDGYRRALTLFSFLVGLGILLFSRSGSCLVAATVVLSFVPLALVYRQGSGLLSLALGLQFIILAPLAAIVLIFEIDLFALALEGVGKDSTLTGRTVLWDFALDAIAERPWLGFGYMSYWDNANPAVPFLRYVVGQALWYFHNSYLEVAVAFGIPGFLLIVGTLLILFKRAVTVFWRSPDGAALFACLFVLLIFVYSSSENPLMVNHGFNQMIIAAVFAATTARLKALRRK